MTTQQTNIVNHTKQTLVTNPAGQEALHQLFEAQSRRTPDVIAVTFEGQSLTYGELNRRANQLAHHLRKLGVGPDVLVGMCMERSLEMIVAILGVLKAGGAYVPLDLAYPKERLAFMLTDAAAAVLITEEKLKDRLPVQTDGTSNGLRVVWIDRDQAKIADESSDDPDSGANATNLAYVIYTSGSTGRPKGVLVTHRNVVRLFTSTDHWYGFGPDDVWTLFHSYAFDFSVWEIWGALLYGGRLVVVPYLVSRNPSAFYQLLAREQVTVLNQTPSAFRQLIWVEESSTEKLGLKLRYIIFGGEALELQSLKPWFNQHGDQRPRLVNMYGITETTVHVTYRPIALPDLEAGEGSVIGVPIPDLQVHVLDSKLEPVPVGEEGEMYVGGEGLARGYLNRSELTAERFIPDPFRREPGARLYKTGDVARRKANGDLEYLGRCDDQVKIRGFRIELGEIESVLNRHDAVRESVVIADSADRGEKRLVGYITTRENHVVTISDMRDFLKLHLPEYMVPSAFVFVKQFPLTPNGKVDRKALPKPGRARPLIKEDFVAPRNDTERSFARIWEDVLEVQPVGIHDSFFELGGDSIRAIQLLARAQQQGIHVTLAQLFHEQTIARVLPHTTANLAAAANRRGVAPFSMLSPKDRAKLPADIEDAYPMLRLQTGMFYHNERRPESAVFHDVFSFRIEFPFDPRKLEKAIELFADRHPIIRTSFDLGGYSEPIQLVHRGVRIPFGVEDLRHLAPSEQTKRLEQFIDAEKYRPFDRSRAPLMRIFVQIYNEREFQLIVSFHHAVLDGWSLAAMLTEVLGDYSAIIKENSHTVIAPRVHYREYVALEQEAIASRECEAFWAAKLAEPEIPVLPRWPRSYRTGGTQQVRSPELVIPADVFEGLKSLAQQAGVPLKSVLQAAHHRVMSFLHGKPDVISGLVTNGRPEEIDGERMIGLFLNTVPLRMRMPGGSWLDLVRQMFATERELLPHRRYPLAEIQRVAGGQQLFESTFDFVHFHVYKNLQGYKEMGFMEGHYFESNSFVMFTTFMMDVTTTQLQMHIDYEPDELCLDQIKDALGYYQNVLAEMVRDPNARYETFCPMSAAERQKLLTDWNHTESTYPRTTSLHQCVEQQVRRTPDAVALICGEDSLTYAELNRRANRLAHHLTQQGVGPDALIGLCINRTPEMVIAMLAILKAGGAYVPLDPNYPADWLAFVIEDTRSPVLITQEQFKSKLPSHNAHVICLDAPEITNLLRHGDAVENPTSASGPDNLAYIIYTSGSTGRPKGVAIEHHSPVNLVHWAQGVFTPSELAGTLASTSICFDLSVFEIFVPLGSGGTVILAHNALQLSTLPARERVTLINTVPSAMKELLRMEALPASVRVVNLAGEPLSVAMVKQIYAVPNVQKVYDLYGPSETTTYSTFTVRRPDGPATVGRPIANTELYLLDSNGQPVPIGVPGELHIAGDGVARGYLNRPELTAEKFLRNPFAKDAERPMYRTGDLARYLPDGNLEFLGRIDHQVKIRGYRIELGEIQSLLQKHESVREAVVLAREDAPGDKRLVAYLTAKDEKPKVEELRSFVARKLPEHMVPSAFVILAEFPLTPNGKIDRKKLPAPDLGRPDLEKAFVAPRNPAEESLARMWSEVLRVDRVGIYDNFFALGGHSLLATQVISRIRTHFRKEIPLRSLFEAPTVAELSVAIEQVKDGNGHGAMPELKRLARRGTARPATTSV